MKRLLKGGPFDGEGIDCDNKFVRINGAEGDTYVLSRVDGNYYYGVMVLKRLMDREEPEHTEDREIPRG